jgi:prolyl-tRNA editing enzyme YbaK/EbsC (Cys-tRNA(Pro) deacylase)
VHPATDKVTRALAEAGATGAVHQLDSSARTAALAAEQLGVEVGAIANSLVFAADGRPLLVLTSGGHRVDTALLARTLGVGRISRADPDFVREHTGQAIGGVAPVGHPGPLTTVVDQALAEYPVVWAAAGHPNAVFPTSFDELVRITGGTPAVVASDT